MVEEILSIDEWGARLSSSSSDVVIFQNVYNDSTIKQLDPSFLPVDGRNNARTESREIGLFLRMFHSGLYQCARMTGILSPKFNEKTRLSGQEFFGFIRQNPGYNVYFINPWPQNAYYTFNVWDHGDLCHPGLAALAEVLFERAGYDRGLILDPRDAHATLLYSSYWVGDQVFWNGYLGMITRLIEALETMPQKLLHRYFAHDPRYPDPVPIFPFIFERSFSAYLHADPGIRALAFPFMREDIIGYCGDNVEREIVAAFGDLVDEIDNRSEYTRADREVFTALTRFRAAATRHRWD